MEEIVKAIHETFEDIELKGRTINELLDFENQADYKILAQKDSSKQIEYLTEKQEIVKNFTKAKRDKDFTQYTLDGISLGCPLYIGIDGTELKKWFNKIYYSYNDKEFYNTETMAKFPTKELEWLIRPDILKYYHDSIVSDFYQATDRDDGKKATTRYKKLLFSSISSYIIHNKPIEKINISQDLWTDKQETKRTSNNVLTIVNPLVLTEYAEQESDNYKENTEFWEEYANFNDEIDWICACRFASTRKRCYRWQRFPSSWGKSFKANIYHSLGILWEFDVNELVNIIKKNPAGVSAMDLYDKWIFFFDEFNFAHGNLKKLDNHLSINQKNSFVATVEVYAKLFNSAEDVKTLTGDGVETQFSERFLFEKIENSGTTLDGYELYNRNKHEFVTDVTIYAYRRIQENLRMYKKLGRKKGTEYANNLVDKTYEQYKWTGGNLEDIIKEGIENLKETIASYYREDTIIVDVPEQDWPRQERVIALKDLPYEVQKIMEHIHEDNGEIYVQSSTRCEVLIARHLGIGSSEKKIGYKTLSDITDYPSKDISTTRTNKSGKVLYVRYWFDINASGLRHTMKKNPVPEHLKQIENEWNASNSVPIKPTMAKTDKQKTSQIISDLNKLM